MTWEAVQRVIGRMIVSPEVYGLLHTGQVGAADLQWENPDLDDIDLARIMFAALAYDDFPAFSDAIYLYGKTRYRK